MLHALVLLLLGCPGDAPTVGVPESPRAPAVEVTVEYGSEKKAWLDAMATEWQATDPKTASGAPIRLTTHAQGSGEGMLDILSGASQPTVYSPASTAYLALLNDAWLRQAGHTAPLAPPGDPIVLSPMVIAMWKPMAEALGWPGKQIGWRDLLTVSRDRAGWGAFGHPEFGDFKLGHTHPGLSNSGLLAVLAEVYAGAGKTRGLTQADVDAAATATFVERVESSLIHYGKSTSFLFDKMRERGPSYVSAAVLYENLVIEAQSTPTELPMVAIYPVEGTFWSDHPYSVLDAPWVDPAEREAAQLFLNFLKSTGPQQRALAAGFRPADTSLAIGAPIDAAHGVDANQPQTLLELPDGPTLASVLDLWKRTKKRSEVALVFDKSGSMRGEPLQKAKEGAAGFLDTLDDRDSVALVFFDTLVGEPGAMTPLGDGGREALKERVAGTVASGKTALYDAVVAAYRLEVTRAEADPGAIHAVVVLTDGRDESSQTTLEQALAELRRDSEAPVKVFTLAYGDSADPKVLADLAEAGKGSTVKGGTGNITTIFRDFAAFF